MLTLMIVALYGSHTEFESRLDQFLPGVHSAKIIQEPKTTVNVSQNTTRIDVKSCGARLEICLMLLNVSWILSNVGRFLVDYAINGSVYVKCLVQ